MSSLSSMCDEFWGIRFRKALGFLRGTIGVLLFCLPLFSQANFGRIMGTVTDQSGGVVAGAAVTVLDTQRGVSKHLVANDAGEYNAPNLSPGTYIVRAEAKGSRYLNAKTSSWRWVRKFAWTPRFGPVIKPRRSLLPNRFRWWIPPTPRWEAPSTTKTSTSCR